MKQGFMYLMAIIDLESRYMINWSVSNTMDTAWSEEGLREAIDNVFVEMLWRSVKVEHVCSKPASGGMELCKGLKE